MRCGILTAARGAGKVAVQAPVIAHQAWARFAGRQDSAINTAVAINETQ